MPSSPIFEHFDIEDQFTITVTDAASTLYDLAPAWLRSILQREIAAYIAIELDAAATDYITLSVTGRNPPNYRLDPGVGREWRCPVGKRAYNPRFVANSGSQTVHITLGWVLR